MWNILSSCYCGLFVFSFLSGLAHPPKVKYSLKSVIVACSLCSYTVAFQDQYTLPKRNILSQSCYCGLLSLLKYIAVSGPAHPPKDKYSLTAVIVSCSYGVYFHTLPKRNILSQLLLWFVRMEFPFRTSAPSQSEIFSQSCYCGFLVWSFLSGPAHPLKVKYSLKAVIVACSLCSYTLVYQNQYTLPKRNILSPSHYCGLLSLLVYSGLSGPAHPPKVKYSLKLLLWLALSARMYVLASQDQHTLPKWNILSSCYCDFLSLLIGIYWP